MSRAEAYLTCVGCRADHFHCEGGHGCCRVCDRACADRECPLQSAKEKEVEA